MKDLMTAPFMVKMIRTVTNMYQHGWDERNGGNVSLMLEDAEVAEYLDPRRVIRTLETGFTAPELEGKTFLVTGTGKYFKTFSTHRTSTWELCACGKPAGRRTCCGAFPTEGGLPANFRPT